ncbi:CFI-box-CTERM domain-containing protein [Stappia sp. ES.058]|uniref:CFI-box-CTERM domain-containing protein n=1 Tax=Stappia sp. ES.058 TaxID=1881061 RepID=UPI00087C826F|nr:CFI-box-CTERM domain-containing protein [Stappia sp. ES.058]SDU32268.1 hypothetical protein SAMN05428979_2968 [Stappia sp. ES.058]
MSNLTRRHLLGAFAATGLSGYCLPVFADVDEGLCNAETRFKEWTLRVAIRSRYTDDKFIGHRYSASAEHRPTGLTFDLKSGSTYAIESAYFKDGSAIDVSVPDETYNALFTPKHQGKSPREMRTFFLLKDPDGGGETSIVYLYKPMELCSERSEGDIMAENLVGDRQEPCVDRDTPDQLPRFDAANPSTTGWHREKVSSQEQTYAAADLLRGAKRLQLITGYYDTDGGKWKRLAQVDLDTDGLGTALDQFMNDARARLSREESGPETCGEPLDCFLTTACCVHMGRADDCFELRSLRAFRDGWLSARPGGLAAIAEYYRIAPGIARAIQNDRATLARVYWGTILPCVAATRLGAHGLAFRLYCRMVRRLAVAHPPVA